MSNLKTSTDVEIKGKKFKLKFPTIGQYIEIEGLKQSLSKGNYALMSFGGLKSSIKALDLIDAVSYFSVLIGDDLLRIYKVDNPSKLLDLPMEDGEELIRAYRDDYSPFHNSIEKRHDRDFEKEKNVEKKKKDE